MRGALDEYRPHVELAEYDRAWRKRGDDSFHFMRRIEWQVVVEIGVHAIRESFRTRGKKSVGDLRLGMSSAIQLDNRLRLKSLSYRRRVDPE